MLGFGVFAYHTGSSTYGADGKSTNGGGFTPNFMYNQMVSTWDESGHNTNKWFYSPIKYWPNGNANTSPDNAGATADGIQNVSFFAYAPYIPVTQIKATDENGGWSKEDLDMWDTMKDNPDYASMSLDDVSAGLYAMSGNAYTGDPTIFYRNGGNNIDLLWGTMKSNGETVNGNTQDGVAADDYATKSVNENLTKMKVNGTIGFNFIHTMAQIGGRFTDASGNPSGITIKLDPDETGAANTWGDAENAETKVTVKSIIIAPIAFVADADGKAKETLSMSGKFNLATGKWTLDEIEIPDGMDVNEAAIPYKISNSSAVSYDGTLKIDYLAESIKEPENGISAWSDLSEVAGVPADKAVSVYDEIESNAIQKSILLFPGTIPTFTVTVNYIVRTKDDNLAKGYSEVEQTISKKLSFTKAVEMNKRYNLNLILGLTSLKFTATVTDWQVATTGTGDNATTVTQEVNLPINVSN